MTNDLVRRLTLVMAHSGKPVATRMDNFRSVELESVEELGVVGTGGFLMNSFSNGQVDCPKKDVPAKANAILFRYAFFQEKISIISANYCFIRNDYGSSYVKGKYFDRVF